MARARKERSKLAPTAATALNPNTFVSPISNGSVQGYPTDEIPKRNDVAEIKEVTDNFSAAGIPCCLVAEAALIYYGAGRVLHDWKICVPTNQFEEAVSLVAAQTGRLERCKSSAMTYTDSVDHHFPRFKVVGARFFFVLFPSHACHLNVKSEIIERSTAGLPYPTLPVYAQSLLDAKNEVDLDDLIDGMNLSLDWGEQHLNLEGTVDADWIWWKMKLAYDCADDEDESKPTWYANPDTRRDIWARKVTDEAKMLRQGWKYQPDFATRFRRVGSRDPGLGDKDYC